jgi:hypothetical protein
VNTEQKEIRGNIQRWLEEVFEIPASAVSYAYNRTHPWIAEPKWYEATVRISGQHLSFEDVMTRLRATGWMSAEQAKFSFWHPYLPGAHVQVFNKMYSRSTFLKLMHTPHPRFFCN